MKKERMIGWLKTLWMFSGFVGVRGGLWAFVGSWFSVCGLVRFLLVLLRGLILSFAAMAFAAIGL